MYSTSAFRKGLKIEIDGVPWIMVDFQHVKPGKGGAFVRTRIKSLVTGLVLDKTFRSGDKVGQPGLTESEMQFLYKDQDMYHFMDMSTYDQMAIPVEGLGDTVNFLIEEMLVTVLVFNGRALTVDLPNFVAMPIAETGPGVKGDTATGATKPATLGTGYTLQVPLFINEGDKIRIDTRTGNYVERVKS